MDSHPERDRPMPHPPLVGAAEKACSVLKMNIQMKIKQKRKKINNFGGIHKTREKEFRNESSQTERAILIHIF